MNQRKVPSCSTGTFFAYSLFYLDKGPVLEEMQRNHEALNDEYNEAKSKMMTIRNQEKSITEQKNRTKIMLEKLRKVIVSLRSVNKILRFQLHSLYVEFCKSLDNFLNLE